MKKILIADDDALVIQVVLDLFKNDGLEFQTAANGEEAWEKLSRNHYDLLICDVWMPKLTGLELLARMKMMPEHPPIVIMTADDTPDVMLQAVREQAFQIVNKPFRTEDFKRLIHSMLDSPPAPPIEVVSASRDWVELLVPCELRSVDRIQGLLLKLKSDLPQDMRESIGQAFRELLMNAIEWGGKLDSTARVRIAYLRSKRFIIYRISDPGLGFRFEGLSHAAVTNPPDDPIGHMKIREEKGLRPGGLGILMAQNLVDELLYNESHNEVVFIKYLD